jgi:rhamnose transport system ATP-binding protein
MIWRRCSISTEPDDQEAINVDDFILELRGISKTFPGVRALDDVHFQLKRGQIHALMGENGAGKSTFIKVITGVHAPDSGEIILNGKKIEFRNPNEAIKHGIAAIYQHVTCYPDLSVAENIFIGHEDVTKISKTLRWKSMNDKAAAILKDLGSDIDVKTEMRSLSVAQQQIVEIAKALSTNVDILVMDEPTAALTNRDCEELYRITEKLRDAGKSIIIISHKFEDMYRLASDVTVFRDSKYIGSWPVDGISKDDLITAMVGRSLTKLYPKPTVTASGHEVFRAEKLSRTGYFADVSFDVRSGEIVALTGLVGAGRSEVCQAIFGVDKIDSGKIFLEGKEVRINGPLDAMNLGIGFLPEDRQKQGLLLPWSIEWNITLPQLGAYRRHGVINRPKEREVAEKLFRTVSIKAPNVQAAAGTLSGGNQQKIIVAKLLACELKLIIMDEPTKGIDIGAKNSIYEIMRELTSQGYGILMVSSEMPEVMGMSDRVVVMHEGRVTMIDETPNVSPERILEAAMTKVTPVTAEVQ